MKNTTEHWPPGVITSGRLAYYRPGPYRIVLLSSVVLFDNCLLPAGYESDGVSAPGWAALTITRFGKGLPAALVHDSRYNPPAGQGRTMTRKDADDELYANVRRLGFNHLNAWKIWAAVRVGGVNAWKNNMKFQEN